MNTTNKETRTIVRKTNYTLVIESGNAEQVAAFIGDITEYLTFDISSNKTEAGNTVIYSFQVVSSELPSFVKYLNRQYKELKVTFMKTEKGGKVSKLIYMPEGVIGL